MASFDRVLGQPDLMTKVAQYQRDLQANFDRVLAQPDLMTKVAQYQRDLQANFDRVLAQPDLISRLQEFQERMDAKLEALVDDPSYWERLETDVAELVAPGAELETASLTQQTRDLTLGLFLMLYRWSVTPKVKRLAYHLHSCGSSSSG
jgi:hypothetical protein